MRKKKINLWSEDQMISRSGSDKGTFLSCNPSMTYFSAPAAQPAGCVVICPGGGYQEKAMSYEGEDIARAMNEHGIHAFVLDYRITPDYHPAPLTDALRSIEIAREMATDIGYKKDKIALLGFSAGGHLAACAATMWSLSETRPDAVMLCYPVISMDQYFHAGCRANLVGEKIDKHIFNDLSCENRVDRQAPPAFIWHTADDPVVPVEHSLLFASALSAKNVPFELHIYPHGEHGLGLAKSDPVVSQWITQGVRWLKQMGF
jgi:acetyl esterase/lipase